VPSFQGGQISNSEVLVTDRQTDTRVRYGGSTLPKNAPYNKIKADYFTILKNSTAQLLPGSLTNTTTKHISIQIKTIDLNWL
jgi:hypothetical protein